MNVQMWFAFLHRNPAMTDAISGSSNHRVPGFRSALCYVVSCDPRAHPNERGFVANVLTALFVVLATANLVTAESLVVTNGTIIDGTGAEPIRKGIVIIEDDRITQVGRASEIAIPPGARVLDARDGAVLPGMIDSHVHTTWDPLERRRFLVLGVTSV
ncbi:MAG: hypothetical protein JSU86_07335, partial [Phycisphaerales bacterium]